MRVINGIPLGSSLLLPVCTVNCIKTLKAVLNDCFLAADAGAIVDMNGLRDAAVASNKLVAVDVAVFDYSEDSVDPALSSFSLDLAAGTMTMVFDETVDVSSLEVDQLTLSSTNVGGGQFVTLSLSSTSASADGTTVVIDLSVLVRCAFSDRNLHSRMSLRIPRMFA